MSTTPKVLPPINPQPDLLQHIYYLRKEWEHSMQLQHVLGRDNEALQQLFHAQFQFLEHVVLDLSKQIRTLESQVLSEQKSNRKLQDLILTIEKDSQDFQQKTEVQILEMKNSQNRDAKSLMEVAERIETIAAANKQQTANIESIAQSVKGMEDSIKFQDEKLAHLLQQQQSLTNESALHANQCQTNLANLEARFSAESKLAQQDQIIFNQQISSASQHTNKEIKVVEEVCNTRIAKITKLMDEKLAVVSMEQSTMLEIIKAIKNALATTREQQKINESKLFSKITTQIQCMQEKFKSEIQRVSRPLIYA